MAGRLVYLLKRGCDGGLAQPDSAPLAPAPSLLRSRSPPLVLLLFLFDRASVYRQTAWKPASQPAAYEYFTASTQ